MVVVPDPISTLDTSVVHPATSTATNIAAIRLFTRRHSQPQMHAPTQRARAHSSRRHGR